MMSKISSDSISHKASELGQDVHASQEEILAASWLLSAGYMPRPFRKNLTRAQRLALLDEVSDALHLEGTDGEIHTYRHKPKAYRPALQTQKLISQGWL